MFPRIYMEEWYPIGGQTYPSSLITGAGAGWISASNASTDPTRMVNDPINDPAKYPQPPWRLQYQLPEPDSVAGKYPVALTREEASKWYWGIKAWKVSATVNFGSGTTYIYYARVDAGFPDWVIDDFYGPRTDGISSLGIYWEAVYLVPPRPGYSGGSFLVELRSLSDPSLPDVAVLATYTCNWSLSRYEFSSASVSVSDLRVLNRVTAGLRYQYLAGYDGDSVKYYPPWVPRYGFGYMDFSGYAIDEEVILPPILPALRDPTSGPGDGIGFEICIGSANIALSATDTLSGNGGDIPLDWLASHGFGDGPPSLSFIQADTFPPAYSVPCFFKFKVFDGKTYVGTGEDGRPEIKPRVESSVYGQSYPGFDGPSLLMTMQAAPTGDFCDIMGDSAYFAGFGATVEASIDVDEYWFPPETSPAP